MKQLAKRDLENLLTYPCIIVEMIKATSSCLQMFFKLGVLKNFAIFTRKHSYRSLLLIKLQAFKPATLLKRDSNTGAFL